MIIIEFFSMSHHVMMVLTMKNESYHDTNANPNENPNENPQNEWDYHETSYETYLHAQ